MATTTLTQHNHAPQPFGRRVQGCPRCWSLAQGLEQPKAGWGDLKRRNEAARLRDIRSHNCRERGCGPVCTAFDW